MAANYYVSWQRDPSAQDCGYDWGGTCFEQPEDGEGDRTYGVDQGDDCE
jgi:hypothetical protein